MQLDLLAKHCLHTAWFAAAQAAIRLHGVLLPSTLFVLHVVLLPSPPTMLRCALPNTTRDQQAQSSIFAPPDSCDWLKMPRRSNLRWGLSEVTHQQQPRPQSVDRVNIMIRDAARIHIDNRSYH
eukprot:347618-Chlamydomonas_euryale.AAC.1